MSISLTSIDCPYLTNNYLRHLIDQYSIHTTNDFALWLIKSPDTTSYLSLKAIECIQSCIIVYTAQLQTREISRIDSYQLNYLLFDNANLFKSPSHLILIFEYFNQNQWNQFLNFFLLRLFLGHPLIKIKYLNTNISLFDLKYFYSHYCCLNSKIYLRRNEMFEQDFYFSQCWNLETLENELTAMEKNDECIQILIIDDFLSLIKPYLNLDRRMKWKVLQLTYRLNRLAQQQSILIINGLILNTNKRLRRQNEEKFSSRDDIRFDVFHADKYILFQSLTTIEKEIYVKIIGEKNKNEQAVRSKLDLDEWIDGEFYCSKVRSD